MITGKFKKKAVFIAQLLGLPESAEIHIKTRKMKYAGTCERNPDGDFVIRLDKDQHKYEIIRTLGHEMVHVRQYISGQLKDAPPIDYDGHKLRLHIWEGTPHLDIGDMNAYFKSPWEMEARALESWIAWRWESR